MRREQAIPMERFKQKRLSRRAFFGKIHETLIGDVKSLPATALESILFTTLIKGPITTVLEKSEIYQLAEKVDIPTEREEMCKIMKPKYLPILGVVVPISEEIGARLLPGTLLAKNWRVGVMSSIGFGYLHQVEEINFDKGIDIDVDLKNVPLHHMLGGIYLWKVFKERGLLHSIIAHAANNTLAVAGAMMTCPPETSANPDLT